MRFGDRTFSLVRLLKTICYITAVAVVLLSQTGCVKYGYVSEKSETLELKWLAEELNKVCDEVESVVCSDRVRYSHSSGNPALVVIFRHEISEEQAEEVLERLLSEFDNEQLLDALLSHGWFNQNDGEVVFYSSGRENDYVFDLLWYLDYKTLLGSTLFWAKNDCFEYCEWQLAEYIDEDSYLDYIGVSAETAE